MKKIKLAALLATSGLLLQLGTCATDFGYYILQALATQLISGAVGVAAGAT